jgi:uncharacterized protein (TIGR03067 family)
MRQFKILLIICICIGCSTAKKVNTKSSSLNGSWIPVKQEFGGTQLPAAAFEKQKLILLDSTYTFTAESIDKGIVSYSKGKMDIYGREGVNIGKHFKAIYKFENDQLTVCYNLTGDVYPEIFETKGKPMYFLSVFRRDLNK